MARINLLPWREELREKRKKEFFVILGAAALVGAITRQSCTACAVLKTCVSKMARLTKILNCCVAPSRLDRKTDLPVD